MRDEAAVSKGAAGEGNVVESLIVRLVVGGFVWAIVSVVLAGVSIASALPYGGGTVLPLMLVVPWTAAAIVWIIVPLFSLRIFASAQSRVALSVAVLAVVFGSIWWMLTRGDRENDRKERDFVDRFAVHKQYFDRLCRGAGIRVLRTATGVQSVAFAGLRANPPSINDLRDRMFVGDVYTAFDTGVAPEASLARAFLQLGEPGTPKYLTYVQIEVRTEQDGVVGFNRYKVDQKASGFNVRKEFVQSSSSKYLVRIEDISTPADREHWIAGSKWTIVEIGTGAVLGESTSYAMDVFQGQTFGSGMEPWHRAGHVRNTIYGIANACPPKDRSEQVVNNVEFVKAVLGNQ